jgi:glycosyltransferase involved in cell wall biosynthesis
MPVVETAASTFADPRLANDPPVGVADIELGSPLSRLPESTASPAGDVLALVRLHTHPLGTVTLRPGQGGLSPGDLANMIMTNLGTQIASHQQHDDREAPRGDGRTPLCLRPRKAILARGPSVSVIVATRDRTHRLGRCLDSILASAYPHFEVVVVDNDPPSADTANLIDSAYACRGVRYVCEPRRGLGAAHNRGVQVASGEILAFTDDDVVVDRYWLAAIAEGFAMTDNVGAVTGLIHPAELRTTAQLLLERYGAFAKGFQPRIFDLDAHRPSDRRFPLATGLCGSGANMAFDARCLRRVRGFDPALGTGTAAKGGDDLAAFFNVMAAGHRLVYQPAALVRHWHRDSDEAPAGQAYSYGVGLGAYLTDAVLRKPRIAVKVAAAAARPMTGGSRPAADSRHNRFAGWTPDLVRLSRRGTVIGPFAYLGSRWRARGAGRPS